MSSMFVGGFKSVQSIRIVFLCVLFLSAISIAGTSIYAQSNLSSSIADTIQPLIKGYQGDVAVAVYHFESDTLWSIRGDVVMPTASLIKLPVMVEAYRQVVAVLSE